MPKYKSLKDHVYEYISKKIQNGELLSEEKINESEICRELEISRTPAREALIQLSSENLLEYIPRKGFIVKEFDITKKLEIYQIIGNLDALAASLSIDNLTETEILKMEELLEKINISIKYTNFSDYSQFQNEFHDVYINKCNNNTLIELLNSYRFNFIRQTYLSDDKEKLFKVLAQVNKEHKEMLNCFKNKDKEGVERILKNIHWHTSYKDMI
ncbi:GntR family transcriptional regulator [Anaeromicrobium sediminis]|uniref:GntR family transcriptional regulator n=1 Tax=Anaeromicrobium sediminis TaxID=1478221 RepID=A0A267MLX3_9FIRM|nr:GntR family transcriptional regulator [Anaeromicrobium sediminis]PAB60604.1 GntR family transcriptional regulator [Anaeromicrobium sediminis]